MIKNLIYASLSLFGVLIAVIMLSVLLSITLKDIESSVVEHTPGGTIDYNSVAENFTNIRDEFQSKLPMLSLLVSDNALLEIERGFSDVISYAEAESDDEVISSVKRLGISLEHLREMAGISIKSVF